MYYEVQFTSTIYIGVIAESEKQAESLAEDVIDNFDCQEAFTDNATLDYANEIDEDEYDCLTLKADEL